MEKKWVRIIVFELLAVTSLAACFSPDKSNTVGALQRYYSKNLSGHVVYVENVGTAPVDENDVGLTANADYGVVSANVLRRSIYINAIGCQKSIDRFPDGAPIHLARYLYQCEIKLPIIPIASGQQIPQAVHLMMQYWDGDSKTWDANKNTLEASIYWNLNPWLSNCGEVYIYTTGLQLFDTGYKLSPDTDWHSFKLIADFEKKEYISITIGKTDIDLSGKALCQVQHNDWSSELSFSLTTESMNCYPSSNEIFWWDTYFRELSFFEIGN